MRRLLLSLLVAAPLGLAQDRPPTEREIAGVYRDGAAARVRTFPPLRRARARDIRGWLVKFTHVMDSRHPGITIAKYRAVAKMQNTCAEYRVADTMVMPPYNTQVKPGVTVEAAGVGRCP